MSNKIFVITTHDGYDQEFVSEIDKDKLDVWMKDGSLNEGDRIIYPARVEVVKLKKELVLVDE